MPVLVAALEDAQRIAGVDDRAQALSERFWPGPLTLVLPRTAASQRWDLGEEAVTIGVRVPADPIARALLTRTGPLAVTSANRSGEETPATCDGVAAVFGDDVAVYLCAGRSPGGRASTVVDLSGAEPAVLRHGPIGDDAIRAALTTPS